MKSFIDRIKRWFKPAKTSAVIIPDYINFNPYVELCKDCTDDDITFTLNFWLPDRKKWVTIRGMNADEVVEALFEKLELYGWIVNAIQYVDGQSVGGVVQKDNCTIWLTDGDDPYGRKKRH